MSSDNGKLKIDVDKIKKINVGPTDYFYLKMPRNAKKFDVNTALKELEAIFPKNRCFVIPENIELRQLTTAEWHKLGLMKL